MNYTCDMGTTPAAPMDDLLTTKEVADLCRVSTVTVTRWLKDGTLAGIRVSDRVLRFRRSDVEALLTPTEPNEQASA